MPLSGPGLEAPDSLSRPLRRGRESTPDAPALVSAEGSWTWRELDDATDRLGANLLGLGLRPGQRVASLMPNRAGLLMHYVACLKTGLVAVPLNYRYTAREIDHALGVSGASILLAHVERDRDLAESELVAELPRGVIRYAAERGEAPGFETLLQQAPSDRELPSPDPAAPAFIFFTSGSTGPPKGVVHSLETLAWMFATTAAGFELTPQDVLLPGSSISHLGGFMFSFAALTVGARVVVARSFDGDEVLPLLRETRPTVMCMLPTALLRLVREHAATRELFESLRLCRSGGDKVSAELEREFTNLTGFPIDEGYGMTECGLATLNPPSGPIKLGSIGRALPGIALSVRDEPGREVPAGTEGRLWIKARSVTLGYWNNPEATQAAFRDGWLDSGDLMRVDDDGYFWFRGRKKQIIVHDGSNISPQEVEEVLLEHPSVENVGVIGVHDLLHGENVRAYITLRGTSRPTCRELIRFARERIGYKAPEEIVMLDEIPLNPTGKVDRTHLKQLAERHLQS
jgi:acyl-CoA synthetase (AMP-forming)/AMP-acid ligase II